MSICHHSVSTLTFCSTVGVIVIAAVTFCIFRRRGRRRACFTTFNLCTFHQRHGNSACGGSDSITLSSSCPSIDAYKGCQNEKGPQLFNRMTSQSSDGNPKLLDGLGARIKQALSLMIPSETSNRVTNRQRPLEIRKTTVFTFPASNTSLAPQQTTSPSPTHSNCLILRASFRDSDNSGSNFVSLDRTSASSFWTAESPGTPVQGTGLTYPRGPNATQSSLATPFSKIAEENEDHHERSSGVFGRIRGRRRSSAAAVTTYRAPALPISMTFHAPPSFPRTSADNSSSHYSNGKKLDHESPVSATTIRNPFDDGASSLRSQTPTVSPSDSEPEEDGYYRHRQMEVERFVPSPLTAVSIISSRDDVSSVRDADGRLRVASGRLSRQASLSELSSTDSESTLRMG